MVRLARRPVSLKWRAARTTLVLAVALVTATPLAVPAFGANPRATPSLSIVPAPTPKAKPGKPRKSPQAVPTATATPTTGAPSVPTATPRPAAGATSGGSSRTSPKPGAVGGGSGSSSGKSAPPAPTHAQVATVTAQPSIDLAVAAGTAATSGGLGLAPAWLAVAAGVGIASAAIAGWLVAATRRRRAAPTAEGIGQVGVARPTVPGVDLDLLLAGAVTRGPATTDPAGRGTLAADRHPADAPPLPGSPIWVRRLDERIPVMPTHQNVPVDHDEAARVARHDAEG